MSRTTRDRSNRKWAEDLHDGKLQKCGRKQPKLGHKNLSGKFKLGPGGINCICCTKLPPDKLKVAVRRHDRRTFNFAKLFDEIEDYQAYKNEMKELEKENESLDV